MQNQNNTFIQGFWRLDSWGMSNQELVKFIKQLVELGITTFDHADIYGGYSCEEIFGNALRLARSLRQQIQLTTKCGIKLPSNKFPDFTHVYDTSYNHIIESVNRSLKNLATDYIDTILIHRPDPLMNPNEVAQAFSQLRQEGKVLQFGVSNFLPHQLDLLQSYVDVPLVTNQIEASVLCHEHFDNGNIDHLHKLKIRPQIWSPLAGGRVFSEMSEQAIRVRGILQNLAEKYSASIEQVAMAWLLSHPLKFQLIIGSGKIDRIRDSLASQSIDLTRDEWFKIWTAYTGHDIP